MKALKLGLLSVPAVSGFAFVIQQAIKSSEGVILATESIAPPNSPLINTERSTLGNLQLQSDNLLTSPAPNKEVIKEARGVASKPSVFSMLHDYTFKIITPCSSGTAWILDYQIPKVNHYPTVWYIATATHVVKSWKFDVHNNIYKQKLPRSCVLGRHLPSHLTILKRDELDKKIVSRKIIKSPKLFWTAFDLFETNSSFDIKDKNFKDFAVLEITFDSEIVAKNMTNNFAEKYKSGPDSGINIFGEALDAKQTKNNNSRFYSLGYPSNKTDDFYMKNNWIGRKEKGDTLSNDNINRYQIPEEDKVRGFLSINKNLSEERQRQISWGNEKYNKFGHFYYTEGAKLGSGSSGSMMVDDKGNLLGVRAMEGVYSLFTPIRSNEVLTGEIKTPKYDLISGAEGQKTSYKQQVEKYLLKNGKTTWLSSFKNWKYNNPKKT